MEVLPYHLSDPTFQTDVQQTLLASIPAELFPCIAVHLQALQGKQKLSVAILGPVGKPTLENHLRFDLGGVPEREMEKLKEIAGGKSIFKLWAQSQKPERWSGTAPPINCTTKEFFTASNHYTIMQPHRGDQLIRHLIVYNDSKDVAILVVPADAGFPTAIAHGNPTTLEPPGVARHHALIALRTGFKQLIVCVNQIDSIPSSKQQEQFNEICTEVHKMLLQIGYTKQFLEGVPMIPISASKDQHLTHVRSLPDMSWWKGTTLKIQNRSIHVVTLADALEKTVFASSKPLNGPPRIPISGVYKIKGVGDVLAGRVEQGILLPGSEVKFLRQHTQAKPCLATVDSIETNHKPISAARAGISCAFFCKGLLKTNMPKAGDIMVLKLDQTLKPVVAFTAVVNILYGQKLWKVGDILLASASHERAKVLLTKINWKVQTNQKTQNPDFVLCNETAEIVFAPQAPFIVDKLEDCEWLGRVVLFEPSVVLDRDSFWPPEDHGSKIVMLASVTAITVRK